MMYTIYFDKGRRMITVEKLYLMETIDRLIKKGHTISAVIF